MKSPPRVVIIGGGFSGAAVAFHLLRATESFHVTVVEPAPRVGPGLAFGACEPYHLLNVPAGRMSLLPDEPNHFLHWLQTSHDHPALAYLTPPVEANIFAPRQLFGEYVVATLAAAVRTTGGSFTHRRTTVSQIEVTEGTYHLSLADDSRLTADYVVLALGNVVPSTRHPACLRILDHPRYSHDMWRERPWEKASPRERVLFLGTGLTMVDGVIALRKTGHTGELIGLSRRGLLPAIHRLGNSVSPALSLDSAPTSIAQLCAIVLRKARAEAATGAGWQAVIDSLRGITPQLWTHLPLSEQRRFLRHLKSYWEIHRHRLAPELHVQIEALRRANELRILAGNLVAVEPHADGFMLEIRDRGATATRHFTVDRIINCTGPEARLDRTTSPLLRSLFDHELISADPLGLGLRATSAGYVINRADAVCPSLLTLGPLLRGSAWETTAVPEIRVQAVNVARAITRATTDSTR
jgi:uncharacterized NAD(P)/FAD-binding protein YdhS